jgi:predicted alpha/beta-fold hydrolase
MGTSREPAYRARFFCAPGPLYNGALRPFRPLFRNAHLLTIAGNFWPRTLDLKRFPAEPRLIETEPGNRVLVISQNPAKLPIGRLVMVHGLEGSSDSGYKKSMAQHALEAGYAVHRFNMRSCGGTEDVALSSYHAGQTSDLDFFVRMLRCESGLPTFLIGFSLGGNVVLKLAGELGLAATGLIDGVCAVSTPIDLGACVERLGHPENFLYENRFLSRLKQRVRNRARQSPAAVSTNGLDRIRTVYEFDDVYTAKIFGFGTADNYYETQSAKNFLDGIRVPALIVQAKDDPLIPFRVFDHPAFRTNPNLTLVATDHGGHLGFVSRTTPRFWLDPLILGWTEQVRRSLAI